jgi:hypothetical protein
MKHMKKVSYDGATCVDGKRRKENRITSVHSGLLLEHLEG